MIFAFRSVASTLLIRDVEATAVTTDNSLCSKPLPELEIPMINAMVARMESEHRKFSRLVMRLAFGATRHSDDDSLGPPQLELELWNDIQSDLWPHFQIEDELVLTWGVDHHAIPLALLEAIKKERHRVRELATGLAEARTLKPINRETASRFAQSLLNLAHVLDSHVQRYDSEVLPLIRRAAFRR
jgi:hypothetical protein